MNIIKVLLISMTIIDMIIIAVFGYLSLVLLNGSRTAKSIPTFQKYHIGWHIIGGLLMSWIVVMEHTAFYGLNHPIIQIKEYLFAS